MFKLISVHSYRRGTGKSNLAANVTALLATEGQRVGVIDMDFYSPSLHVLFGLEKDEITYTFNDYLRGQCEIQQAVYDLTPHLGNDVTGKVYLVPASDRISDILDIKREGYPVDLLSSGFRKLIDLLALDILVLDANAGLSEETLNPLAISDTLAVVLRPDQMDYQGTAVMVGVARRLNISRLVLVINNVPSIFDFDQVKGQLEETYDCEVAAVLPHCDEMLALSGVGIFALLYPDHPLTKDFKKIAVELVK